MSSEVKQMNDKRYYECEERVKHIRIKEFHRLENLYAKIRKKTTRQRDYKTTSFSKFQIKKFFVLLTCSLVVL